MSGTLLTGEKKIRDIMTSLLISERVPPDWGLYPELSTMVDRRGTSGENAQKGDSQGVSPALNQDHALSAKVTTGNLSAPVSSWKARCHLLWIDGSQPPIHGQFLGINIEEPQGSHSGRKAKGYFLATQWSPFFLCYLSLSVPSPMTKVIIQGKFGQPLEHQFNQPLACSLGDLLFCHSFLIAPETPVPLLGWDFLFQLKAQILLSPRQLSLLPPLSGTNRSHSVD
jgi:hypothetical protein